MEINFVLYDLCENNAYFECKKATLESDLDK